MSNSALPDGRSLTSFIRTNLERILQEWVVFAGSTLSGRGMSSKVLRDHAAGMLLSIADEMDRPQGLHQQVEKSMGRAPRTAFETEAERHGAARVASGFTVGDALAEFRALRASVLRLWSQAKGPMMLPQAARRSASTKRSTRPSPSRLTAT